MWWEQEFRIQEPGWSGIVLVRSGVEAIICFFKYAWKNLLLCLEIICELWKYVLFNFKNDTKIEHSRPLTVDVQKLSRTKSCPLKQFLDQMNIEGAGDFDAFELVLEQSGDTCSLCVKASVYDRRVCALRYRAQAERQSPNGNTLSTRNPASRPGRELRSCVGFWVGNLRIG